MMIEQNLRGDAEDGVDELTLSYWIAFSDPTNLAFSDHMHRFVTFDCSPCVWVAKTVSVDLRTL
jgi:hypothetical protein